MAALTIIEVQAIQTTINTLRSKRARILKGLQLLLQTITMDRNYSDTVEEVSFNVKGWRDKTTDQTPVIYIIDDATDIVRHAGMIREFSWKIPIFGVVKGVDMMAFEEFIADIEECIYDNNSLFGNVNKMEINSISTDNQLFSQMMDDGPHLFELVLDIQYTRNARVSR